MAFENTLEFALQLDAKDPLKDYRNKFYIPQVNGRDVIYFCGNSLGLQPKTVADKIDQELKKWAKLGVKGYFESQNPWITYNNQLTQPLAKLAGAMPSEVVAMNTLTTNLHLMLVSFYRPTKNRYKILCEEKAFPSDQYALESQVRFHGFDPDETIVEIAPGKGEHTIRHEDILTKIHELRNELALIMLGGVNYYTGQLFDIKTITKAGHDTGALVGFDLAHAIGNVQMNLHDWEVDFAVWCSYKYLNSGPASIAGVFVHRKHENTPELPRFAGWWGNNPDTRFLMKKRFEPATGADGWQLSNGNIFSMAAHKASLDIFEEVGMDALCKKSEQLTGYMEFIIDDVKRRIPELKNLEIITPEDKNQRGCQLSVLAKENGKTLFDVLSAAGVIADWREPGVIRMAPVPLYNCFEDVFRFGELLSKTYDNHVTTNNN